MTRIFPEIRVVNRNDWMSDPEDKHDMRLFLGWNIKDQMAFYHHYTKRIYIREDCYTYRILFHELVHWVFNITKLGCLNKYWDKRPLFRYHMLCVAIRVGLLSKSEVGDKVGLKYFKKSKSGD